MVEATLGSDAPGGRPHRQASAGPDRAGVHPSWHDLIRTAVTPAALLGGFDFGCCREYWSG